MKRANYYYRNQVQLPDLHNKSETIDITNKEIFQQCFRIIKNFYSKNSNEILCKEEDSNLFLINYQKNCKEENNINNNIEINESLKSEDFITSMASVHRNALANKDLFAILNGKNK